MDDKEYRIIRVAELYFKQGYSQQSIANILGISRTTVSRLINESKNKGIVKIYINTPYTIDYNLSTKIKERFKLKDALVVNIEDEDETITLSQVGTVAASFVMALLKNGMVVGISFGKHIKHVVDAMPENELENIEVVQLVGALGSGDSNVDGPVLAIKLANTLHAKYKYINSPAVVSDENIKKALLEQPQIKQTFSLINQCNIAIHGIGSLDEENSSMQRSGYIDEQQREKYAKAGAVGHVLGHMIDIDGNIIKEQDYHTIGAPLDLLKNLEWSIGVATNSIKYKAVIAAINGGYVNCLIINRLLANKLLQ
ncbi:deoxyribonucleoside regulator [Virgibacillus halotolerans]|uniref:sugar-binding transcriptional regulator n=1 Tax=Virgibacillus halotolerans TaxID=1071053 RepID=UPI00195FE667|nr:sugar-binding transcriptional regulator [Virgibacillus halotolerans]MBM7599110.1 deoxyribonucleoside regulator [Virgibacillus halotolerans]